MIPLVPRVVYVVLPLIILPISYIVYMRNKQRSVTAIPLREEEEVIYDIAFFTDKGAECRQHITANLPCHKNITGEHSSTKCVGKNIRKIVSYIDGTKDTLDVCIYLVTCVDFGNAIKNAFKCGKKVRLIADADMIEESGAQIKWLKRSGVPVRMKKSPYLMHHKFLIIDRKILLTGSFNWTMQAMAGNWDNMIVTSQPILVQKFCAEFDELWSEFGSSAEDNNEPRVPKISMWNRKYFLL